MKNNSTKLCPKCNGAEEIECSYCFGSGVNKNGNDCGHCNGKGIVSCSCTSSSTLG